jgi:flagellar biosynthetic protein FliQ
MTPEFVVGFAPQAQEQTRLIYQPLHGVGLGVGLFVSIIQAATQIQEATLAFIPKILSMFLALLITFPWIMEKLVVYTRDIFINLPMYVRMGSG